MYILGRKDGIHLEELKRKYGDLLTYGKPNNMLQVAFHNPLSKYEPDIIVDIKPDKNLIYR